MSSSLLVQKAGEGNTSHELGWEVKVVRIFVEQRPPLPGMLYLRREGQEVGTSLFSPPRRSSRLPIFFWRTSASFCGMVRCVYGAAAVAGVYSDHPVMLLLISCVCVFFFSWYDALLLLVFS